MDQATFHRTYELLAGQINEWLASALDQGAVLDPASRYGVLGGGKRLRGVLLLAVAEMIGCPVSRLRGVACSVEMLHAASLIHDDLPALDNDDLRRGKPTCHRVFGEGIALLAGDALIARAHDLILSDNQLEWEQRVVLARQLSRATQALCDGQALDLAQTGLALEEITGSGIESRHRLKTGALFSFCASAPFLALRSGEASEPEYLRRLEDFGLLFGLLFQIADDILGATASTNDLGKHAGIDEAHGVPTFVSFYGLDGARNEAGAVLQGLIRLLAPFHERASFLIQLSHFALERTR